MNSYEYTRCSVIMAVIRSADISNTFANPQPTRLLINIRPPCKLMSGQHFPVRQQIPHRLRQVKVGP